MKFIKYLIVIAIIAAGALVGLDIAKKQGKINIEIDVQTETNSAEVKYINARKLEHHEYKSGMWNWTITQALFSKDITRGNDYSAHYHVSAIDGYELYAFDKNGNNLGIVETMTFDASDGGSLIIEGDFNYNEYVLNKDYFKIVAKKIGK